MSNFCAAGFGSLLLQISAAVGAVILGSCAGTGDNCIAEAFGVAAAADGAEAAGAQGDSVAAGAGEVAGLNRFLKKAIGFVLADF